MPVLLDRGELGYRPFAPAEGRRRQPLPHDATKECIDIALVNNMPDSALETTERQVLRLLDAAAEQLVVRLSIYSLPELERNESGRRHVSTFYRQPEDLYARSVDALIVTGTEPRAANLTEEPYWGPLTQVLEWAEHHTVSTILSCLAVHAAVLYSDGIGRCALPHKCFGVFDFNKAADHPILDGVPSRLRIPHSRWNEVREPALALSGYTVLTRSEEAGVDMFLRSRDSLFLFFQGHPEYEAGTLLREYRRDIGRFLRGERETYPSMPQGYFSKQAVEALDALGARAVADRREELLAEFPTALIAEQVHDTWRTAAAQIYRNWLMYIFAQKTDRLQRRYVVSAPSCTPLPTS